MEKHGSGKTASFVVVGPRQIVPDEGRGGVRKIGEKLTLLRTTPLLSNATSVAQRRLTFEQELVLRDSLSNTLWGFLSRIFVERRVKTTLLSTMKSRATSDCPCLSFVSLKVSITARVGQEVRICRTFKPCFSGHDNVLSDPVGDGLACLEHWQLFTRS